jgi:cysteine desulfurase
MVSDRARVYLDHNATSPPRPEALRSMLEAHEHGCGNPSSLHAEGRAARALLERARDEVAELVAASPREVVFTSGGTEAISAAVRGVVDRAPAGRRRLVVSAVEHSAVLAAAHGAGRAGFEVELVACGSDGRVSAEAFNARLGDDVVLGALQWANNETGVVQPVEEVGRACRRAGVPFLVDAVQAAGRIPTELRRSGADLMALSGHKLGGPQGTGALLVREGIVLAPLIAGGAQERRRRAGTEAVAALAGFGAAAHAARVARASEAERLLKLRARLETRLRELFASVRIHGESAPRLPNTVSFSIPDVPGETLAVALDLAGFAVATGSACASGAVEPSHVLVAMGLDEHEARTGLRVSLGWSTSTADVDRFVDVLPAVVERVRGAA